MEVTLVKPLAPIPNGVVVIVGAKTGNFDEEITRHPRVVLWDSQHTHWTNKDLPSNTKAVFMTRFVGHSEYGKILAEARKKGITLFNPDGTGVISRQVRELLGLNIPKVKEDIAQAAVSTPKEIELEQTKGKLEPLKQFIDVTKGNVENAKILMVKAKEMGIQTTEGSLSQLAMLFKRKKAGVTGVPRSIRAKVDVSVEILDNMIKELQDMRQFLIDTVEENRTLRMKMNVFKKMFEE